MRQLIPHLQFFKELLVMPLLPMLADLGALEDNRGLLMAVMTICGILVVFIGLSILIVVIGLFGKIVSSLDNKGKKNSEKPAKKSIVTPDWKAPENPAFSGVKNSANGVPDEVIAVIAAAVASLEGGNTYAIRSVRRASEGRPAWSMAGVLENTRPF